VTTLVALATPGQKCRSRLRPTPPETAGTWSARARIVPMPTPTHFLDISDRFGLGVVSSTEGRPRQTQQETRQEQGQMQLHGEVLGGRHLRYRERPSGGGSFLKGWLFRLDLGHRRSPPPSIFYGGRASVQHLTTGLQSPADRVGTSAVQGHLPREPPARRCQTLQLQLTYGQTRLNPRSSIQLTST
jgi:hypothetical protein